MPFVGFRLVGTSITEPRRSRTTYILLTCFIPTTFVTRLDSDIENKEPKPEAQVHSQEPASQAGDDARSPETQSSPKRKRTEEVSPAKRARGSVAEEIPSTAAPPMNAKVPAKSSPSPIPQKGPIAPATRKMSGAGPASSASASASSSSSASAGVQKSRSDALRNHATEQFRGVFRDMFLDASNVPEDVEEKARTFAMTFESALFESNAEVMPKSTVQVAGKAYRDKLRSFLFNLKDKSNKSLRARIASDDISAAQLATMSSDELANDEIRKEVERRKRENLEQSILKRDTSAPLRKLTHKGEVDIEYEAPPSHQRENEMFIERPQRPVDSEGDKSSSKGKTDKESTEEAKAVTAKDDTTTSREHEQRRRTSQAQSPTLPFDFGNVWTGEQAPEADSDVEEDGADAHERDNQDKEAKDASSTTGDAAKSGDNGNPDNFIDSFLGMQEGSGGDADAKEASLTKTEQAQESAEPLDDAAPPRKVEEEAGWRGAFIMPDEGAFTGSVRHLAGRALVEGDWANLFASPRAQIEGRLPSSVAMPYLLQSRIALRTELVALSVEQTWEPSSVPQSLSSSLQNEKGNNAAFSRLLNYFHRRGRYGVLQCAPAARGQVVKDFYISALPHDQPMPEWLQLLQPKGLSSGQTQSRDKDLFVLVAVLFKQGPSAPSGASDARETHQSQSRSPTRDETPATSTPTPFAPSSSTLQDLLKAVGGSLAASRSPAMSTQAQSTPPQSSPASSNPLDAQSHIPSASQMQQLSEMPKPQLEDVLTQNPSLVDNLLKALGSGRTAALDSSTQSLQMPGPPPPRPPIGAFSPSESESSNSGYGRLPMSGQYGSYQNSPYGSNGGAQDSGYGPRGPMLPPQQYGGYGPQMQGSYGGSGGGRPFMPPQRPQQGHFGGGGNFRPPPTGPRAATRGRRGGRF